MGERLGRRIRSDLLIIDFFYSYNFFLRKKNSLKMEVCIAMINVDLVLGLNYKGDENGTTSIANVTISFYFY